MTKRFQESVLSKLGLLAVIAIACGPRVEDDQGGDAAGPEAVDDACGGSSCPLQCGEDRHTCPNSLGIGACVDDECSPSPWDCVIESSPEKTCEEACESKGVICVENGCEGATAFGYPGPATDTVTFCGDNDSQVRDAVVPIQVPCEAPLVFTGEGSFELYQCCCDDPSD
jgi:hypothetical protein